MATPTAQDLKDAIQGVWLETRYSVGPTRFLSALRGRERACILRNYRTLESIWRLYSVSLATSESRKEALAKADRYLAIGRVVERMELPAEVLAYDPTTKGDVGIGDDPIPGVLDPAFFDVDGCSVLADAALHERLAVAGWKLPPPLRPLAKCEPGVEP